MRWSTIFCFVFLCVPASWAQQQELSLIDRLLRPNMELQNNAQGKKFMANSAVIEGRGTVGTLFLPPNRHEKSFGDLRELAATKYPSRSFHDAGVAASAKSARKSGNNYIDIVCPRRPRDARCPQRDRHPHLGRPASISGGRQESKVVGSAESASDH